MEILDFVIIFLFSAPLLFGIIWVYGTWRNWKVFMNPSDVLWFMWLWHLTKKYFGEEGMKILNYTFGILLLIGGIYFFAMLFERSIIFAF